MVLGRGAVHYERGTTVPFTCTGVPRSYVQENFAHKNVCTHSVHKQGYSCSALGWAGERNDTASASGFTGWGSGGRGGVAGVRCWVQGVRFCAGGGGGRMHKWRRISQQAGCRPGLPRHPPSSYLARPEWKRRTTSPRDQRERKRERERARDRERNREG